MNYKKFKTFDGLIKTYPISNLENYLVRYFNSCNILYRALEFFEQK